MKKKFLAATCAVALGATLGLAGCGGGASSSSAGSSAADSTESSVIKVGAVPTPHAEILEEVVKPILAEEGYDLEVVEFNDYVLPNQALSNGEIDANYFQHVPYLDDYNKENDTDLVSVAAVHFEPMPLFAGKTDSIETAKASIENGEEVTIAVPNDTTNEARALLLLADQGLIELPKDAGLDVTAIDIVNKPDNLTIEELEAAQVARSLDDVDLAVINGNYAVEAGLDLADALAVESADSEAAQTYANVLVVNSADEFSNATKALAEALNSEQVKKFIEENYGNAVVAVF